MTASASNLWSECNDRTADDRQIGFRSHPSGMRPETNGFSHDLCMKQSTGLFHSLALLRPVFRIPSLIKNGAVKKVPSKRQAAPNGAACKIYVEKGLVQWKNQPFGVIMNL